MLVTLMGKPPGAVFAKMNDADSEFHVGDVKYHAGEAATLNFEQVGFMTGSFVANSPAAICQAADTKSLASRNLFQDLHLAPTNCHAGSTTGND